MSETRSKAPLVVGILMIVFAGLGLLSTFGAIESLLAPSDVPPEARWMITFAWFGASLDLAVGIVHLAAGLAAVRYRLIARRLAWIYAIAKFVTTALAIIGIVWASTRGPLPSAGEGAVIGAIAVITILLGAGWPIVVLWAMRRLQ